MAFVYVHGGSGYQRGIRGRLAFAIVVAPSIRTDDLGGNTSGKARNPANMRILVCATCLDIPQPQLRTYIPPPDPIPI